MLKKHRLLRLPIVRGVVALGESLVIGFKALGISANAQLPEEEKEISGGMWAATVLVALVLAVGLFFVVPGRPDEPHQGPADSSFLFWLVEGIVRTAIFLGYLLLLSRLRDLRRVFEYHGAEHKTISCYEAELELTPENAQRFSRLHPRCGTSFLLIVMIVAIFVFAPIGLPAWYLLVLTRIVGVPLIAGISFEIIKFAGRNRRRRWVRDRHVPRAAAAEAHDPRARPRPARRRDRRDERGARGREPARRLRRGPDRHGGRRRDRVARRADRGALRRARRAR